MVKKIRNCVAYKFRKFLGLILSSCLRMVDLTRSHTMTPFDASGKEAFENIVGKEENAGNQHFLLFPQCFLLSHKEKSSFWQHLNCRLQMLSIWTSLKFCRLVMG